MSKEQEHFQNGYIKYLRQKLKFRTEINTRVKKTLKKVAKKIGKKPKGEKCKTRLDMTHWTTFPMQTIEFLNRIPILTTQTFAHT